MAYTAVEVVPTNRPLIAIYDEGEDYTAQTVWAYAIYRNPDAKGSDNYIVPLTAIAFGRGQVHYALNARELDKQLPFMLLEDEGLYEQVREYQTAYRGSAAWVQYDSEDLRWIVDEVAR